VQCLLPAAVMQGRAWDEDGVPSSSCDTDVAVGGGPASAAWWCRLFMQKADVAAYCVPVS